MASRLSAVQVCKNFQLMHLLWVLTACIFVIFNSAIMQPLTVQAKRQWISSRDAQLLIWHHLAYVSTTSIPESSRLPCSAEAG